MYGIKCKVRQSTEQFRPSDTLWLMLPFDPSARTATVQGRGRNGQRQTAIEEVSNLKDFDYGYSPRENPGRLGFENRLDALVYARGLKETLSRTGDGQRAKVIWSNGGVPVTT